MNSISLYKAIAKKYDEAFKGENKFLNRFAGKLPKNAIILDIGCGTGEDTKYLVGKGFAVISVDSSNEMIKIAKKKLPNQKFVLDDMRKLRYPKENFDGIVAAFSLIHLRKKDVTPLVRKFFTWTNRNGLLYIALQEGRGEKILKEPFDPKLKVFLNLYTEKEISELLRKSGFKIIFSERTRPRSEYEFNYNKIFIIAKKV